MNRAATALVVIAIAGAFGAPATGAAAAGRSNAA